MSSSSSVVIISKCTVYPETKSTLKSLKLSVSDLPMLSCQYIQKGVLLSQPPLQIGTLISLLKLSLSKTLSHFPPLAGRLSTDADGHVHILCNNSGVDFIHSKAQHLFINDILAPLDVPDCFKQFFAFDDTLSYAGHYNPLAAVQLTELGDGVFVGCSVNHAVVDGTSFWHFFNTFAEVCRDVEKISKSPDYRRDHVFNSPVPLRLPAGEPIATLSIGEKPLRERIFHFSREAVLKLKFRANNSFRIPEIADSTDIGSNVLDAIPKDRGVKSNKAEISSLQSLCAHLWRSVTRARKLKEDRTTTFYMAVNCRHRLLPPLEPLYFGNMFQTIPTATSVAELLSRDLCWGADLVHQSVVAHDDVKVRRRMKEWESNPRLFSRGNIDDAAIIMGSSPRFPLYDNDFGWGRPLAVRSGRATVDGKILALPGREGDGCIELEVVLAPEAMAALEADSEFMEYIS